MLGELQAWLSQTIIRIIETIAQCCLLNIFTIYKAKCIP